MKTPPLGCAVLLALVINSAVLALFAQTPPPATSPSPKEPPPATSDYDLRWGVKIPMRDKVDLNATLYLPKTKDGAPSKTPAIFIARPWRKARHASYRILRISRGDIAPLADVPELRSWAAAPQ